MNTRLTLAIAAVFLAVTPATAADHGTGHKMNMPESMSGKITIKSPWARASIGKNGAAFVTLVNAGNTDDKLIGATANISRRVELHTHKMDGNIMRMRQVENVPLPAGSTVMLKPGGHHVMFMGLTRELVEGQSFPLTLIFEKAGQMEVSVKIGKMGASGPMGGMKGHGGHKMKH